MTTLGSPGLSSQSVSGFSGRKGPKNPEMDWDDNPGKPRLVIPMRFGVFWPKRGNKNPKRTGMTTLGSPGLSLSPFRVFLANKGTGMTTLGRPGLSSQSISGFSGRKEPRKPETDWDDNHGKPKLVIPVRFGVFWPTEKQQPETDWDDNLGKPRLVIPVCFGVFSPKRAK